MARIRSHLRGWTGKTGKFRCWRCPFRRAENERGEQVLGELHTVGQLWLRVVLSLPRPQDRGVWMYHSLGQGGCPGRRGRMSGHRPVLHDAHFCPPSSHGREQESVFCFGINWAGCGQVVSRLPQLRGSASFIGLSTVVTELPLPHFAVLPPQLHLPPLVLALPHPSAQPGESLPWKGSQMGSILLFPGWVLEKHPGITDEEMKAEGGQGLPGASW